MLAKVFYTLVICLTVSYGDNKTSSVSNESSSKSNIPHNINITIADEGGPTKVISSPLFTSFPEKKVTPGKSHIRRRPGADARNITDIKEVTEASNDKDDLPDEDTINKTVDTDLKVVMLSSTTKTFMLLPKINNTVTDKPLEKNKNETQKVKKPTILSYEKLVELDNHIKSQLSDVTPVSSSQPVVANQMAPPSAGFGQNIHISGSSRTPAMVIPIIITILVVPAFGVLAYMALKRGQEAWKNRHYKRMDFLLDGMYND